MPETMIGAYGPWAAEVVGEGPPELSLRTGRWKDLEAWRARARARVLERIAQPPTGGPPKASVHNSFEYDGLHVKELSWQLPYGPPTEVVFLKPKGARGPLPGVLALHDHGGLKYFGKRKIARTSDQVHPLMLEHQEGCYGGVAWANELARRGYAVLVHDAFTFASRRVKLADVPQALRGSTGSPRPELVEGRGELVDPADDDHEAIAAYNEFAARHENIMAKSLFSAGTTWPGVFSAEDQRALDYLASRPDVDAGRLGCGGLSGGGLRTVFLAGLDPRIRACVCVGFMSTWRDFLLNKCWTHTWMTYVPLLPRELDFPEILGLRVPLPTLVLNDIDDQLYTMPEMERADAMLREVYEWAGRRRTTGRASTPAPTSSTFPCRPRLATGSTAG